MAEQMIPMLQPKRVLVRSSVNNEYKIRIARPITEIDDFEEEIMALEEASENDVVFVQLSSPGGSLETCDFICRRMEECRAPIVAEIGLTCASAASAICLHADDWIIHDSSTMMVHACSYSPGYGKEVDVRSAVENTARINKEWVERVYRGFLTDEELKMVLDGKDLYFYADDLRKRLPEYREYRNAANQCDEECGCEADFEHKTLEDMIEEALESTLHRVLDAREKQAAAKAKKAAKKSPVSVKSFPEVLKEHEWAAEELFADPVIVQNVEEFNKITHKDLQIIGKTFEPS